MAISLSPINAFKQPQADAVAFNAKTGNLFLSVINLPIPLGNPDYVSADWRIDQYTTSGQFVSSFKINELNLVSQLVSLPNGNLLMMDLNSLRIAEFTTEGQLVAGGIDFTNPIINRDITGSTPGVGPDMLGLTYDPSSDTIYTSDFYSPTIYAFDRQGNLKTQNEQPFLDLRNVLAPNTEFRALTIDPITENFFVATGLEQAGDLKGAPTNKIFEITKSGQILQTIDTGTDLGFDDPEGIDFDPTTRTLYLAFDDDDANGVKYEYTPRRNWLASYQVSIESLVNDPGTNDSTTGDAGSNSLLSGLGNDTLMGMEGNDILDGGGGDDFINGNQDNDLLIGGSGNDTMYGGKNDDSVYGGAGNDYLSGDLGTDYLDGGDGDDILVGGFGEDVLTGGAGNDVFVLTLGQETDSITDFTLGSDSFRLTGLTYEQITLTATGSFPNNIVSIRFVDTGEVLATLTGVATGALARELFTLA